MLIIQFYRIKKVYLYYLRNNKKYNNIFLLSAQLCLVPRCNMLHIQLSLSDITQCRLNLVKKSFASFDCLLK